MDKSFLFPSSYIEKKKKSLLLQKHWARWQSGAGRGKGDIRGFFSSRVREHIPLPFSVPASPCLLSSSQSSQVTAFLRGPLFLLCSLRCFPEQPPWSPDSSFPTKVSLPVLLPLPPTLACPLPFLLHLQPSNSTHGVLVTFKHFRALRNQRGTRRILGGYCLPFSDGSECKLCSEITCTFFFFFFFSCVYLILNFLLLTTSTTMDYLLYLLVWVHSSVKGGIKIATPVPSHRCIIRIK